MRIISLFSGCGGLDLGFKKEGFEIIFSNDNDKNVWETYEKNFGEEICKKSIKEITKEDLPENIEGVIGGPPCQSWSEAGNKKGILDDRGKLFFEYIRILKLTNPRFFLLENVSGILHKKHEIIFKKFLNKFENLGYKVSYRLINSSDYGIPQDRKRIILIGFKEEKTFNFENLTKEVKKNLKDSIFDLKDNVMKPKKKNISNKSLCKVPNHEFFEGSFSSIYMSRNRVRNWEEQSFTIQAGARHAPLHPQAPKMKFIEKNKREFVKNKENLYRRLSVRECARIQTIPDNFIFYYDNISEGYKMIGNAVPVKLGQKLAKEIKKQLS